MERTDATCLGCGYNLHGLPEARCPECGRSFATEDDRTYRVNGVGPGLRGLATPPGWTSGIAVVVLTAIWVFHRSELRAYSNMFGPSAVACCVVPLLILLGGNYFVRLLALLTVKTMQLLEPRQFCIPTVLRTRKPQRLRRWAVVPTALVIIISAHVSYWPVSARFWLSRPAFDRVAQQFQSGNLANSGPQWIGLYHVKVIYVHWISRGIRFEVMDHDKYWIMDPAFVYAGGWDGDLHLAPKWEADFAID